MPYLEETYDIVVVGAGHAGMRGCFSQRQARNGDDSFYRQCGQHRSHALQSQHWRELKRPSSAGVRCFRRRDGKKY